MHGAVPAHVAIIMDGNGRWAKGRSLPRPLGHQAGMKAVREVVEGCLEAGVGVLTLFAFSQENWQRPAGEIEALMSLLEEYIAREAAELRAQGVAVRILGDLDRLGPGARDAVDRIMAETAGGNAARAQPLHLLQLPRRDRPGGAAAGRRRWRRAGWHPAEIDEEAVGRRLLHRRRGPIPTC